MRASGLLKKSLIFLAFPFLFIGCTESSLFVPDLSGEEELTLTTVAPGSLVSPGATLPVAIPEDNGGDYTSLEITLRTTEGETVYAVIYDSPILSEPVLPDLQLPDLKEGSYMVELLLFNRREVVAREESFFFLTSAELAVTGITLYPPTSETDAQLIAEAHIRNSDPSLDPYLRWRFRDALVSEGSLSEEGSTARLATGEESGVFTVTVELFPWAPPEIFDVGSPIFHSTDVVVRPTPEEQEVGEEVYLSFSFDGHGRGRGFGLPEEEETDGYWSEIGDPFLTLQDDAFGFRVDGADGFSRERSLLPVDQDGVIPFRLELTLTLTGLGEEGSYLLATGDGKRELVLGLTSAGEPWIFVDNGSRAETVVAPAPQILLGGLVTLAVEVDPDEEETRLAFYQGEILLHETTLPVSLESLGEQEATITQEPVPTEPESYLETGLSRGAILKAGPGASYVIDHLEVGIIDEGPKGEITTLAGGESLELQTPGLRGDAIRYTVLTEEAEVYLESDLQGSRRLLMMLSGGSSLTLLRGNGELEYIVDERERQPLPGSAFYIRNAPGDPVVEISRQALSR